MRSSNVKFSNIDPEIERLNPKDDKKGMDIIEITFPDGKVSAFPANDKSPETGVRYRDMFPGKYAAFKNGNPDPDRVAQLNREIAERQAELDSFKKSNKPDEDKKEDPKKIDQPVALGPDQTKPELVKPVLDPVLVHPVEPKEPV